MEPAVYREHQGEGVMAMQQRTRQEIYANLRAAVSAALERECEADGIKLEQLPAWDAVVFFSRTDAALWAIAEEYDQIRQDLDRAAAG